MSADNDEPPTDQRPENANDRFDDDTRGCEEFEDVDDLEDFDFSPDRYGEPPLHNFPTIEELRALENQIAQLVQNAVEELPNGDEPAWKVVNHLSYAGQEVRRARRARRIGKEDGVV